MTGYGRRCPGCRRSIAFHLYACGLCWRKLPKHLRDKVSEGYALRKAGGGSADHEAAKQVADKWLADHYGRNI